METTKNIATGGGRKKNTPRKHTTVKRQNARKGRKMGGAWWNDVISGISSGVSLIPHPIAQGVGLATGLLGKLLPGGARTAGSVTGGGVTGGGVTGGGVTGGGVSSGGGVWESSLAGPAANQVDVKGYEGLNYQTLVNNLRGQQLSEEDLHRMGTRPNQTIPEVVLGPAPKVTPPPFNSIAYTLRTVDPPTAVRIRKVNPRSQFVKEVYQQLKAEGRGISLPEVSHYIKVQRLWPPKAASSITLGAGYASDSDDCD